MDQKIISLSYEVELKPGEKLTLPPSLLADIGEGRWLITIQQQPKTLVRSHDAFLNGYAPEDEGLYDDYPNR